MSYIDDFKSKNVSSAADRDTLNAARYPMFNVSDKLKATASATAPVIFRFLVRKEETQLSSEFVFRPWARVSRHDIIRPCSSKYGPRVDLRLSTLVLCALLATSGLLHRCTTVIPSAHPPLAISTRNARTQSSPLPPPSRPRPWVTPTNPALRGWE